MKRSPIVRLQIALIFVTAGLLIWRSTWDTPGPEGTLTLVGLDAGQFYSRTFELTGDGRIRVEAAGSTESEGGSLLAAYPWIVRRDDRAVVWQLDPAAGERERTLVRTLDTLSLPAGAYDLYYSTYGATPESRDGAGFLRLKPHWTNEKANWMVALSPVDSIGIEMTSGYTPVALHGDALWNSRTVDVGGQSSMIFITSADSAVNLQATAGICEYGCDDVRIERVEGGESIWTLTEENTSMAGGAFINRTFDGIIPLEPGIYRLVAEDGYRHGYDNWSANPPADPETWGVRLIRTSGIMAFDPWSDRQPLVSMLGAGDDVLMRTIIQVDRPTRVYVDAMGELMSEGSKYDYAWIQSADDRSRIWEQEYDTSQPAGGDDSNRRSTEFLKLEPGRYSVYFQSDGSHAYGSFNRSEPDHPERWGVAVFLVDAPTDSPSARVVEAAADAHGDPTINQVVSGDEPLAPMPPIAGELLYGATSVRNDSNQQGGFELSRATRIRIVAVGEMTRSGRYDYGWIEAEGGDVVWEQSMSNTRRAGGDDRNRLYDDVITLPAGRYVAHFQTDFSHAFGDFDSGAPSDPGAWGMRIVRMPE